MNYLAIYWLIGCLVIGGTVGTHASRCPSDVTPPLSNILVGVAVWPALLIGAIGISVPTKTCDATTDASTKGDVNG